MSPARDRVVAILAAPPADRDVAKHHKGGTQGVNESPELPRLIHIFRAHILSGTSIPNRSRTSVKTAKTRAQSPSLAARKPSSVSDRTWWAP
jgi:hypothetical protein